MNKKILDLNFAQLAKAWSKSKFNNYSDDKKQNHVKQLSELYNKLKEEDFSVLDDNDIVYRGHIIDFFFKNLEFLENSTLNLMPFEMVECLKYALADWLDNPGDYIIVTSLVNDFYSYSFDAFLAVDDYYNLIHQVYGLSFTHRLIQINIPRFLVRDYLASVVLYHELGHFVDTFFEISSRIAEDIRIRFASHSLKAEEISDIEYYFPFIVSPNYVDSDNVEMFASHISEFFCDVFASQYVGDCLNHYLLYITKNQDKHGPEHPASTHRVEMVNNFLSSNLSSFTLKTIIDAIQAITSRAVIPRSSKFKDSEIINLLPAEINDSAQLHYLFAFGWDVWLNKRSDISTVNGIYPELSNEKVYEVINNLIEKSIGNYIVVESWKKI